MYKTFRLLDINIIMYRVKGLHQVEMDKLSRDPDKANDIMNDHILIVEMIMLKYTLQILKLCVQLFVITAVMGNIIYILIDLMDGMQYDLDYESSDFNIIGAFEFYKLSEVEKSIKMTYWTFTTLSTVGFGDIHPRSNFERVMAAIVMLVGVIVFSLVKDRLALLIDFTLNIDEDFDDGIEL
jgi:hypothetical protein